jgi:hypothetical protein
MTTTGHNNPPAEEAFGLHIDELFSLLSDTLSGGPVETDEQEAAIDALSKDFLKAKQDADKARAAEKKPHDDAAKAVQTKWKPIVDKAARGQTACGDALTPYRVAKQRAKDEAARKAREGAEERQRKAQEALQQSEDLEQRFEAEQDLEAAKKLNAVANKIDRSATGLRTYWEAEITDKNAALRHYLPLHQEAFLALIQELADRDARGARPRVPGVTYHEQKKAA